MPCRSFPVGGRYCFPHDPANAERMGEARRRGASKGGRLRAIRGRRSRLATVPELVRFVADLVHRTIEGELEVDVARCVFYGLSLQKGLVEMSDIERRLAELEARLPAMNGGQRWRA